MTDSFRESRVRNYEVKTAAGFRCQHEEPAPSGPENAMQHLAAPRPPVRCTSDWGLLVVKVGKNLEARCAKHRKGKTVMKGQWDSRPPYTPMADPVAA